MSSEDDKNKKGPKLFRPGALPSESDKPEEKDVAKPKLFRPMDQQVPSPSGISPSAPSGGFNSGSQEPFAPAPPPKSSKPKLFSPSEMKTPESPTLPPTPSGPKLFKPTATPTPAPPQEQFTPATPPAPSGPKLFKPTATPTPAPSQEPSIPSTPPTPSGPKLFKPTATPTPSPSPSILDDFLGEPTPSPEKVKTPGSSTALPIESPQQTLQSPSDDFGLHEIHPEPADKVVKAPSILDEFLDETPPQESQSPKLKLKEITPTSDAQPVVEPITPIALEEKSETNAEAEPEAEIEPSTEGPAQQDTTQTKQKLDKKSADLDDAKAKIKEEKAQKEKLQNTKKLIIEKENLAKKIASKNIKNKNFTEAMDVLNEAKELAVEIGWKEAIGRIDKSLEKLKAISNPNAPSEKVKGADQPPPDKKVISRDKLLALAAMTDSDEKASGASAPNLLQQKGRGVIRQEIINKEQHARKLIKAKDYANAINELTEARTMAQKIKWLAPVNKFNKLIEKTKNDYKGKGEITETGFIRAQLFEELDVRAYWYKAIGAGFIACISMVFISYVLSCFSDKNLLARTFIFTPYSHNNVLNEFLGLWAVSFTPYSQIGMLDPGWGKDSLMYLLPTILAALIIALNTKHPLYALIGTGFFVFFSIVLPFAFLMIFPAFGIMDPSSIDAGLISAFAVVIDNWGPLTTFLAKISNSVFFGYSISGLLEISILLAILSALLAFLFLILKKMFRVKG